MSLLDKALAVKRKNGIDNLDNPEEAADLAMAWARGEVGLTQVTAASGKKSRNTSYNFLAIALRYAIKRMDKEKEKP